MESLIPFFKRVINKDAFHSFIVSDYFLRIEEDDNNEYSIERFIV